MLDTLRNAVFEFLEDTREGKIWRISALHVTTTRNNRKYTKGELEVAARSLSFRPLNINHDDATMLPYPENETLETDFDPTRNAVVGRMRINSSQINHDIQTGKINKLSVEQIPIKGESCGCNLIEGCACEQHGITFVGLALLTSDKVPGDSMTEIKAESASSLYDNTLEQIIQVESKYATPLIVNATGSGTVTWAQAATTAQPRIIIENCTFTGTGNSPAVSITVPKTEAMKCPACGYECDTEEEMKKHMQEKHSDESDDESKILRAIETIAGEWGMSNKDKAGKPKKKKVYEKDDIGACVSHFVDDGKDQDQAVAICINDPTAHETVDQAVERVLMKGLRSVGF